MNTYRKILIFVILLTMLASGCSKQASPPATPTSPPPTPTMGPVDVVKAYEDAWNRHDVPGAMAWLTEDVSFSQKDLWELTTQQDVQKGHEFFLALPVEVHYTDCQTSADTVTCKMTYADACTQAFGMNAAPGETVLTIVNNKIKMIKWTMDPAADAQYWANFDKFMSWFEKTYPDEYKWTQTDDNWLTKENGAILAKRFQEYGATLK
jgi:hypothetical protein